MRTAGPRPSGTPSPHSGEGGRRRPRRCGVRPLSPLAGGHRDHEAARRDRLSVLHRLVTCHARGSGPVNAPGLAFYDRLVDALLDAGITPFPTLYHWDLPQVLQDAGGWTNRDTARHFADYSTRVVERLGDRVTDWATVNEPMCAAWIGHLEGRHAPGIADVKAAVPASYHLLLGHGLAAQAVRAAAPGARVGITHLLNPVEPAGDSAADAAAAARFDGHTNRWWLDPVFGRGFPADMLEVYGVDLPEQPGDLETIAAPLDWLGVNYYRPAVVADDPDGAPPYVRETTPAGRRAHRDGLGDRTGRAGEHPDPGRRGVPAAPDVRHRERLGVDRHRRRRASARPRARRLPGGAPGRRARRRSAVACRWPGTSAGRCWTTSNGRPAMPRGSGSSTSTSRPSGGPSRPAASATPN